MPMETTRACNTYVDRGKGHFFGATRPLLPERSIDRERERSTCAGASINSPIR
jgi:hypothetical protein